MMENDLGFLCFFTKGASPKKVHATYESAFTEATRLAGEYSGGDIYILSPVEKIACFKPKVETKIVIKKKRLIKLEG